MDLVGLTSAITDIIVHVNDEDLSIFGLNKAGLSNHCLYENFFNDFIDKKEKKIIPAGSSANVLFNLSSFNFDLGLIGTVGNDYIGNNYIKTVALSRINSSLNVNDGNSAISYVMITPDAQRTFLTKIGVAYDFKLDYSVLKNTKYFHTSGYELLTNREKTKEAIYYSKQNNAKISFDLSDPFVIKYYRHDLESILNSVDILFATEDEAYELTGISGLKSINELRQICPIVAYKMGNKGSIVADGKNQYKINPCLVNVMNTCGAGDAYSSGFLYGQLNNLSLYDSGKYANLFASKVCEKVESNLL